jgi:hypothetical protein
MVRSRITAICLTALSLAACDVAIGQSMFTGKPLSTTGGFAQDEMRTLYRSGVGTGYSGSELNRLTEASLRANVPNVGQSSAPRIGLGAGGTGGGGYKPFSNFNPSPTVSPYLNLFRDDFEGNDDFNYQTLVRPQLDQQRFNDQLQRQSFDLNQRLQAMAAQPDFNPRGNQNQMPTGHQTVFQYHSHFYPQMGARQRR